MEKINEYKKHLSLEEAVEAAVKYCIEHDILREFISEITGLSIYEIEQLQQAQTANSGSDRSAAL